jgi:hypothetical protein
MVFFDGYSLFGANRSQGLIDKPIRHATVARQAAR